ncbi:MAG: hypothetical protein R3Y47_07565 [Lachnospiraceae bacterium]
MYTDYILKNMPRVITQIDRDEHSKTYGSCDRNHWHLKIRDFSSAILQQSGLALALAYETEFEGNIYYRNENIKKWAIATVTYWAKIQLRDGSYNEYYPWEHGFPPTAFSLYSACEIYKRFQMKDEHIEAKMRKTCHYLMKHVETQAYNQEMASITALHNAYLILQEQFILDGVNVKLEHFLQQQSVDGWFPEYGGADIGYLSVCFDMLSEYYCLSQDARVLEPMHKTFAFIQYFIHPDSTVGGEYGSRNTTYFLPNGLQVLSNLGSGIAERAIEVLYSNTKKDNYFLDSTDDRYFSHYVLHSFLRATEKRKQGAPAASEKLPFEYNHHKVFEDAGLMTYRNDQYYMVVSTRKGGVIKVFADGEEKFIDCGYRVNYGGGCVSVTNWLDPSYDITYTEQGCVIKGYMNNIKFKTSSPILLMGLRVMAFIFGNKLIHMLKKLIILVDKHDTIEFERVITFTDQGITLKDSVQNKEKFILEKASNMSARHVASGKFFMTSELLCSTKTLVSDTNHYTDEIVFHVQ